MKHNKRLTALLAGLLAVSMLFSGCSGTTSGTSDTGLIDGTYEGTGAGYGGNIKLALTVEGGIFFVILGPLFYYFRLSKKKMAAMYLVFSLGLCLSSSIAWYALGMSAWDAFFGIQYQWMMVFALPILWCYNGKKGKFSFKYLFYLFYPLHIWALYTLSTQLPQ